MSLTVVTTDPGGANPVDLATLGAVGGVKVSSRWPYGTAAMSCTLDVPAFFNHYALRPGRWVFVRDGLALVWGGILADPQRGTPWQVAANGWASLADDYANLTTTTVDVAGAIGRGLPWVLRPDVTVPGRVGSSTAPVMLNAVLDEVHADTGTRWGVAPDRTFVTAADPTVPAHVVTGADTPGSRSIDGYVTHAYAVYITSADGVTRTLAGPVTSATTAPDLGRYERYLDLTDRGPLNSTQVDGILAGRLQSVNSQLPPFVGSVTVQPGQVTTLGGAPVSLSTYQAGQMIELRGAVQDPTSGSFTFAAVVRFVVGEAEYDDTSGLLRLTPLGASRRDLSTALAYEGVARK